MINEHSRIKGSFFEKSTLVKKILTIFLIEWNIHILLHWMLPPHQGVHTFLRPVCITLMFKKSIWLILNTKTLSDDLFMTNSTKEKILLLDGFILPKNRKLQRKNNKIHMKMKSSFKIKNVIYSNIFVFCGLCLVVM